MNIYIFAFVLFFSIKDIDECKNPELAAKCVENAECCNLPAHYSCKCKPGFQGDGEKQCLGKSGDDISVSLFHYILRMSFDLYNLRGRLHHLKKKIK